MVTVTPLESVDFAAEAALDNFDAETAVIMVAIAGAESGYNVNAQGDSLETLACFREYGHGAPCDTTTPGYKQALTEIGKEFGPFACNGFTSIGPWQINMRWNWSTLTGLFRDTDPCTMSLWLQNWGNNARAAKAIFDRQGFQAWTTWVVKAYLTYVESAREAVIAALERRGITPVFPVLPIIPPKEFFRPGTPADLAPVEPPPIGLEPPLTSVEPPP